MARPAAATLLMLLAGCAGFSVSPGAHDEEMRAVPDDVVQAAVEVFEDENIPVADYRPGLGTVTSETFDPRERWGDAGATSRVACGVDDRGERRTRRGPMTLRIDLEAERSARRSGGPPNLWSTVRIRSRGTVSPAGDDGSHTCALTPDYRDRLFQLIRRRAERYTA